MKIKFLTVAMLVCGMVFSNAAVAKKKKDEKKEEGYVFTDVKRLPATSIKDQHRSGTCWSFSGLSFIESEMIRMGKSEVDLSEMFVVWQTYSERAYKHVRMHGKFNFGGGGAFHDVTNCIRKYGIVPEEVYTGLHYGEDGHTHGEMDLLLKDYVDAVIKNRNRKLTPVWHKGFNGILDAYLGEIPEKFDYKGKEYTPQTFAKDYVGVNPDDYVEISSYTHHPFYSKFVIEVPDNWSWDQVYNVPLNEMMEIMESAIMNGYTLGWASDVSEKGFSFRNGVAIVPEADTKNMTDSEISKWENMSTKEKASKLYSFNAPGKEKEITQEMRQEAFDNYKTTDDHGMHITGIAKDQKGSKYFIVKNSWGLDNNDYEGYFYASFPFVAYKTMSFMVHKDAIPAHLREKMGL
jgi:bleomycin hydrolase